jgi:hypothetical protein
MKSPRFCHHNNINAEALLQFTLKTIATRVKRAGGAEKIRAALVARAKAAAGNPQVKSPDDALRSQLQTNVETLRQQAEQAPRRVLEAEDEDIRAMLRAGLRDLRAELAHKEKALLELNARTPHRPETLDVDAEVQKALDVIERIETACGDPVAREQVPRLLSDLGVRIGLTFREGRAEENRKVRRLQGGIIAFGNRPLPCVLRTGPGGRSSAASPLKKAITHTTVAAITATRTIHPARQIAKLVIRRPFRVERANRPERGAGHGAPRHTHWSIHNHLANRPRPAGYPR